EFGFGYHQNIVVAFVFVENIIFGVLVFHPVPAGIGAEQQNKVRLHFFDNKICEELYLFPFVFRQVFQAGFQITRSKKCMPQFTENCHKIKNRQNMKSPVQTILPRVPVPRQDTIRLRTVSFITSKFRMNILYKKSYSLSYVV